MSWHYQVRKYTANGQDIFDIVEVFTNPTGWTESSIHAQGETKDDVIHELEMMLADARKFPVLDVCEEVQP